MNAVLDAPVPQLAPQELAEAIATACARVAPLWPLSGFVAVNPFLGFTGGSFAAAAADLRRIAGTRILPPRAWRRAALAENRITDADLEAALAAAPRSWPLPASAAALREAAFADAPDAPPAARIASVAEVLDSLAQGDRQAARTQFIVDEVGRWCAAYYDEGQALWPLPGRHLPPYAAWREAARHDRNPEAMGIQGFRATIEALPADPIEAIAAIVQGLGIPPDCVADYLYRALADISGWAGFVRHRVWEAELAGRHDDSLVQLLALRLAFGYGVFRSRKDEAFRTAWARALRDAAPPPPDAPPDEGMTIDLLLQDAAERAFQRNLAARLAQAQPATTPARPPLQAAFCIDVRSEVYRRALEAAAPGAATIGFAGFFGFPIEYVPIGRLRGAAHCPVLLRPQVVVCEAVSVGDSADVTRLRRLRARVARAWTLFKQSAVSCFAYVETSGLSYAASLAGGSLGYARPAPDPRTHGIDGPVAARLGPRITEGRLGGRATGFDAERRIAMAEAVLRGMSLTSGFARLVLLAGHGGNTVNNPHASSLDCGACGGNTGEANARVAAAILNDAEVRAGLARRGIAVPDDTWFLPALHDTTTDDVTLFETETLPASHAPDLANLRAALRHASALARAERAAGLGIEAGQGAEARIRARARDWSEVRPEWGLAGNAAFIAAPRCVTEGRDLEGRVFLHSYDWRSDPNFSVLALIMTAPMVVASWISLQYYAATVNHAAFGAGNKALHNVVGRIGVIEGNAGDLKPGLPWQSVHDGKRFVHDPLRLTVAIAAPPAAIAQVVASHSQVRDLVDHGWVRLLALDDEGRVAARYAGNLAWEPFA